MDEALEDVRPVREYPKSVELTATVLSDWVNGMILEKPLGLGEYEERE